MKKAVVSILLVAALLHTLPAVDTYWDVPLTSLKLKDGTVPERWGNTYLKWRAAALRPYVVLDGPGEAYVKLSPSRWVWAEELARASLCVRAPAEKDVTGRLILPKADWTGMTVSHFTLPASKADPAARTAFLQAKEWHYRFLLLSPQRPGAAYFRYVLREVLKAQEKGEELRQRRILRAGSTTVQDTYDLFTGGKAISENLQLDRLLPPQRGGAEPVATDTIKGITVPSVPWEKLLGNSTPALDRLAHVIPADQHAFLFPTFKRMTEVMDEAKGRLTPILYLLEPRAEDSLVKERYQKQLCMEVSALSRLLGPAVIAGVAITGSDPYLPTGTDLAVIFHAKQPALLMTYVRAKHAAAKAQGAREEQGSCEGTPYHAVVTPTRTISSYAANVKDIVIVTNSRYQLGRILRVLKKKETSLAELPEFAFFRSRYPLGDPTETAFLVLSDATIRRWCSARWRIGCSRRVRAAAVLSDLTAACARELISGSVRERELEPTAYVPEMGTVRLTEQGVVSSTYGSLSFLTPISELNLETVTKAEAAAYERWRDGYQQNWTYYFDPIGARFTVKEDSIELDVTVTPLIQATAYRQLSRWVAKATLRPDAGDPHPEALLHVVFAVDPKQSQLRFYTATGSIIAPALSTDPFGWIGQSVALYADSDPFWDEVIKAGDIAEFAEKNLFRAPVAAALEVRNPLTAAVFLSSLRTYVEKTAPGMTVWETKQYKEDKYVAIRPTSKAQLPDELTHIAIYYGVAGKYLTVTLNENLLKRAFDRHAAEAKKKPSSLRPWLGKTAGLRLRSRALSVIDALAEGEYRNAVVHAAWRNIPILNELRALVPEKDPLRMYEKLWKTQLICPAGGRYVWNETYATMESTAVGCPATERVEFPVPLPWRRFQEAHFGISLVDRGVRARVVLLREAQKKPAN